MHKIKVELIKELEEFDKLWANYEEVRLLFKSLKKYITELIDIENRSRMLITNSISIEKEILNFETIARAKGKIVLDSEEHNKLRVKLVYNINQINKVN